MHFERLRSEPGFNVMTSLAPTFPNLYVGNHISARDYPRLKRAGVTRIVCANGSRPPFFSPSTVQYLVLDLEDDVSQALTPDTIERAASFIDDGLFRGEGVLVFCTAGISRSGAILTGYVMRAKGVAFDEALEIVRSSRKWVKPNSGFEAQLRAMSFPSQSCELCRLARTTQWYDESDPRFVIIECDQCEQPMAVWRASHTMRISARDAKDMEEALTRCAERVMGKGNFHIDKVQRTIFDHLHWHARAKPPWMRRVVVKQGSKM